MPVATEFRKVPFTFVLPTSPTSVLFEAKSIRPDLVQHTSSRARVSALQAGMWIHEQRGRNRTGRIIQCARHVHKLPVEFFVDIRALCKRLNRVAALGERSKSRHVAVLVPSSQSEHSEEEKHAYSRTALSESLLLLTPPRNVQRRPGPSLEGPPHRSRSPQ